MDNGEWIIGYHLIVDRISYILPEGYFLNGIIEVDPATVGQYTGLQDMNGSKIFEGDIVKYTSIVYPEDTTTGKVEMYHGSWALFDGIGLISIGQCDTKSLKVIGNIFDNPELWEENQ